MARFLIEVPHRAEARECVMAAKILLNSGSHYMSHADFGCLDGEHKAWVIIEADSREDAQFLVPSVYRHEAKVIQLNKFSLAELDEMLAHHQQ